MNNDKSCKSIKNKDSINNILLELDQLMNENNEVLEDIKNYKKNLDAIISGTDNEFLNLSELEISRKLDNILDDVLQEHNTLNNLNNSTDSNIIDSNKIITNQQLSGNENNVIDIQKINIETLTNESAINDHSSNEEINQINMFDELNSLNDTFLNLLNTDINNFTSNNKNIDQTNKCNDTNNNSDCSTIDANDLETESEAESDLDEYDSSKIKNKDDCNNKSFDMGTLFKSMNGLNMDNFNFEDIFTQMTNMSDFSSTVSDFSNEENLKKMQSELNNVAPFLKQMSDSLSKIKEQVNPNIDTEIYKSSKIVKNDPDIESLDDFIQDDKSNESTESTGPIELKNLLNNTNVDMADNNSETESYYKTDDEDSVEKLDDELDNKSDNKSDKNSDKVAEENKSNVILNKINKLINFDISNIGNMFGLFGSSGKNEQNLSSGENLKNCNNNCNINNKDNNQTYGDIDSDECGNKKNMSTDNDDNDDNSNVHLRECLEKNKKMTDDLSRMMNMLGINNVSIADLANLNKNK